MEKMVMVLPRLVGDSRRHAREFLRDLPRSILEFEAALRDVLEPFWLQPALVRARTIATSLAEGSHLCGFKETEAILRSLASLLALSYGDASAIRTPLVEKVEEMITTLKEHFPEENA
jgi:hypothetical protein